MKFKFNKYKKISLVILAFAFLILIASYLQSDRKIALQCVDFKKPLIWTTQDSFNNVTLHYSVEEVQKPESDKFVRIFWGDEQSEKVSIGLGRSLSGSLNHRYTVKGDKNIEVFFSIAGSKTECGLSTYISI